MDFIGKNGDPTKTLLVLRAQRTLALIVLVLRSSSPHRQQRREHLALNVQSRMRLLVRAREGLAVRPLEPIVLLAAHRPQVGPARHVLEPAVPVSVQRLPPPRLAVAAAGG